MSIESIVGGSNGSLMAYFASLAAARAGGGAGGPVSLTDIVASNGKSSASAVDRPHSPTPPIIEPRTRIRPAPKFEPRRHIDPTPIIEPRLRVSGEPAEIASASYDMNGGGSAGGAVDRPMHLSAPWNTHLSESTYLPSRQTDVVIKHAHTPSAGTLLDVFI